MKPSIRDALALAIASLGPLVMAWLGFVVFADEVNRGQSLLAVVYGIGKFAQFSFPLVYVWLFDRDRFSIAFSSRGIALGILFGVLVDVAMAGLYFGVLRDSVWLADTPHKIFGKLQEFGLATPAGYLAIGLFLCVAHSLMEEYYWRWFVFGWLRRYVPLGWAILISSVAFMAHHVVILYVYFPGHLWTLAAPLSLSVAVGGAVWAWIYHRSGSLWGPWISHVLVDTGILLIGYDMVRGMWN